MTKRPLRIDELIDELSQNNTHSGWIEPSLLPRGGILLVSAQPKSGKSFVCIELARALITATPPFNSQEIRCPNTARVLLIEQEMGKSTLARRIKLAISRHNLSTIRDNLFCVSKDPEIRLDSREGLDKLKGLIRSICPNVILLDPISKFHNLDENDSRHVASIFDALNGIINEFAALGMAIIISHHFKKPSTNNAGHDPASPYNMRGSSRFYSDPDAIMTIHRITGDADSWRAITRFETRHGRPPCSATLTFSPDRESSQITVEKYFHRQYNV
ncbi:MAG: AAA family ATPase [bacterium JZ-2024 1]